MTEPNGSTLQKPDPDEPRTGMGTTLQTPQPSQDRGLQSRGGQGQVLRPIAPAQLCPAGG